MWVSAMRDWKRKHQYVWNREQFDAVDPDTTDYLLGKTDLTYFSCTHICFKQNKFSPGLSQLSASNV